MYVLDTAVCCGCTPYTATVAAHILTPISELPQGVIRTTNLTRILVSGHNELWGDPLGNTRCQRYLVNKGQEVRL